MNVSFIPQRVSGAREIVGVSELEEKNKKQPTNLTDQKTRKTLCFL
jgi:hypothetical protein